MFKKCALCQKGELTGKLVTRKGQYKSKGGTGSKISRWTMRRFLPNLQKMRILIAGHPKRVYVCAKCIKKGNFQKASTYLKNISLTSKRTDESPSQLSIRGV